MPEVQQMMTILSLDLRKTLMIHGIRVSSGGGQRRQVLEDHPKIPLSEL